MNRALRDVLVELTAKDLGFLKSGKDGGLWWVGPLDRRNRAPIGDTDFGTRYSPIQVHTLLWEVAMRPQHSALDVALMFHTSSGALMKAGSPAALHPREISPWRRRFGTLGRQGRGTIPTLLPQHTTTNKKRIAALSRALRSLQSEIAGAPTAATRDLP